MAVRHRPQLRRVDLLISPAGYAFTIWAVIYLACIATGVVFVRTRVSGTPSAQRLTVDLAVACAAAASWLLVSAASIDWLPSVLLTVMVVVLIDAALIAARPAAADVDARITLLVRTTMGIYAAWASAAVFLNWAADLGRSVADPQALGWQLALLIAAAALGVAVTYLVGSALPGYPITLLWALVAIIVNAAGRSTVVVAVAAIGIAAVIAAYLASRRRHDRLVVAAGSTA